ncbi:hypothetical protein [Spirobacillus cienkowskii]|uniref:hypothetical protein n=1 Tax=Spirobacillus cienkowskii TaxID=495820 RepID=UPI0030D608FD
MSSRLFSILTSFIAIMFFYNFKIFAEESKKLDEKKIVEDQVRELIVEDTFTQGGVNYTLYQGIVARVEKTENSNQSGFSNRNKKLKFYNSENIYSYTNKILLDKGIFKIYHKQTDLNRITEPNSDNNDFLANPPTRNIKNSEYKTAFNNSSRKFGVLTGNIVIKISPDKTLPPLDSSYKLVREYQNMGLYLINIPKNVKLGKALEDLRDKIQKHDQISADFSSSVNVEVLENFKSQR